MVTSMLMLYVCLQVQQNVNLRVPGGYDMQYPASDRKFPQVVGLIPKSLQVVQLL